ncbi:MAG: cupin domain-containing protein [Ferruginibacter sp.]|nr:cupin domain-containing protein [Ferruginibacter sp.]
MENKYNDSTPQRPDGERILNADLVEMNLNQFVLQIKKESTWLDSDRNSMTIFKSEILTIVLLGLHKNAEMKTHQANGVISVQVLEGKINFNTQQKTVSLEKGQMIALHENIPHSVIALEETFFLLTLALTKEK